MMRKRLFGLSFLLAIGLLTLILMLAVCDARIASVSAGTHRSGTAIDGDGSLWRWSYENCTAGHYEPHIVPGITEIHRA
jgi:hypothetical protein